MTAATITTTITNTDPIPVSSSSSSSSSVSSSIIVGLAVIGKANEPLYLCDCEQPWLTGMPPTSCSNPTSDGTNTIDPDINDEQKKIQQEEEQQQHQQQQGNSLSLSGQILIHSALDNLEEKIYRPGGSSSSSSISGKSSTNQGQMPVILRDPLTTTATSNATSAKALHWLGLLIDPTTVSRNTKGYGVYGYITATNIKILVITGSDIVQPNSKPIIQLLQSFLYEIHQHYIAYILNPFCDTRKSTIQSKVFDRNVAISIAKVQQLSSSRID